MSLVLELATSSTTRSGRLVGKTALQSLHACFFVDTEHDFARWWIQIQLGNLRDLLAKLRVGSVHPTPHHVGSNLSLGQDALHTAPADVLHDALRDAGLTQLLDSPSTDTVFALHGLAGQGDQLKACDRFKFWLVTRPGPIFQAFEAEAQEPRAPTFDRAPVHTTDACCLYGLEPVRTSENDSSP